MHEFVCFSVTKPPGPTAQFTSLSMQIILASFGTFGFENRHAVAIKVIVISMLPAVSLLVPLGYRTSGPPG